VFIEVKLEKQMRGALNAFESAIPARVAVMACYRMTGAQFIRSAWWCPICSQWMEQPIVDDLAKIAAVSTIRLRFARTRVNYKTALPLPGKRAQRDAIAYHSRIGQNSVRCQTRCQARPYGIKS
jgi:hypothetical protein